MKESEEEVMKPFAGYDRLVVRSSKVREDWSPTDREDEMGIEIEDGEEEDD